MSKQLLTGSFVALITPMNPDYSIDFGGFRSLIEFQRENGTSGVLIMGSSGEVSMLTEAERHAIVAETMKHKLPGMEMWYGCTGATTEATIAYVRQAAAEGADGAMIAAPAYICAANEDIVEYFLEVADASPIPLGIYNNPPRVKTDLSAEEVLRIAAHPNVQMLKESTGRVAQAAQIARAKPEMSLMCCCSPNLGLIVPIMTLGGHGTANMTGNIIPREMAVISKPWQNFADATNFREAYLRNLPMLHYAYSAINPVPMKSLMAAMGMPAGPLRKPQKALTGAALQRGLDIVDELNLVQAYGFTPSVTAVAAE
ncbi:MAG: 4-hydroxy-tetrahydrodipicolinate synthase [Rhodospirillaceae bacterium]|jgi:4-hydroxy-tetrahydrodipicolinate synthase|nr:4-hydroxy-tetrahydrodipicolinate synthase [Rhodospirillaceae bacterium]MBT4688356.1 4-hydroxy-tetrahydrodipicolinate synthase [Rhodospirillaceae bacterium]MBT5080068.1 4-hydroxy-tetrahydrodipicolinate synthase [Rhodospirillaceae bacterium]MBT5525657.1 4-hydroxy-tetrahydrodipicolinate synthase [Rhodospirillaceae bacterium]MBT5880416.1 4-hydroxy-tetrahydrodipicolinate synthase [Rhodospirillaceae bacterium]